MNFRVEPLACCAVVLCAAFCAASAQRENETQPNGPEYRQLVSEKYAADDAAVPPNVRRRLVTRGQREVTASNGEWFRIHDGEFEVFRPESKTRRWESVGEGPVGALTTVDVGPDGMLWVGSKQGAMCRPVVQQPEARWRYCEGRRYLPDDEVVSITAEPGGAWMRTREGFAHIYFQNYSLANKSQLFLKRIRQRHNRYGLTADCELLRAGDTSSSRLVPSDNDGLWTAIFVASECFRYSVTQSAEALENARESLHALLRLESITGIPGFPARSYIQRGDYRRTDGEWHWTADGQYEWKGDTSSDELVGHFFAYAVAYELLPGEVDEQAIRGAVERIADNLLDHSFNLVGFGGKVTRWGRYAPEYFHTPEGYEDAPLDSLELLSHLSVARHVTGKAKFRDASNHLIKDLGYLRNVMRMPVKSPAEVNYSDEELAYLAFNPLLKLEDDPGLRAQYQQALAGLWNRTRDEHNPLWDYIYAAGTSAQDFDAVEARRTLEEIPLDTISWTVRNSPRRDLALRSTRGRFGEKESKAALSPAERAVMKWNGNPFQLDGGNGGVSEDDGAFFLLPYWMARYHHFITE